MRPTHLGYILYSVPVKKSSPMPNAIESPNPPIQPAVKKSDVLYMKYDIVKR